jgi:hypothetical protein
VSVRLALATIALATLAACGPVQSTAKLIDAEVEIEAARAAGAAQSSTYEYVSAQAYFSKARELEGYARYEAAVKIAGKSLEYAKAARKNALAASNRPQENP